MHTSSEHAVNPQPTYHFPTPLSSFIGRRQEVAAVIDLLATTRLLTLTGAGGSGKTRLALRVAEQLAAAARYPGGIWFVELAGLADGALVAQTVAAALGVREQPGRDLAAMAADFFGNRAALLILDNCEHIAAACAAWGAACLRACPKLTILATSREPLQCPGETIWQAPPLSLPPHAAAAQGAAQGAAQAAAQGAAQGAGRELAETVAESDAVQLFLARAAAALPAFQLTAENAGSVIEICRRLDGLPLAIELAAARVRLLNVADIAARLDHSLQLLARGAAGAPLRHQTLRAAIDWSYDLLPAGERTLLGRLAVFAGDFTLQAAETICAGDGLPAAAILDMLAGLLDKSLVVVAVYEGGRGQPTRYRLLEIVRQYGEEKLATSGAAARLLERHFTWCLALAEAAAPELKGRAGLLWLEQLDREHDNLRSALRWGLAQGRKVEVLRLSAALHWYWDHRGYLSEGRAWLNAALQQADAGEAGGLAPPAVRAHALLGAAALAFNQGDWAAAGTYAQESVTLFRQSEDRAGLTLALLRLGFAAGPAGEQGRRLLDEALALAQTLAPTPADQWVVALTYYVCGQGIYFRGDYPLARVYLRQALRLLQEAGDLFFLPRVLSMLAGVDLGLGDYALARTRLEESLALLAASNDLRTLALVKSGLGDAARCQGDYARAEQVYQESLALYRTLGNTADIPAMLHNLGYVALGQHDVPAASAWFVASLVQQYERDDLAGVAEGLAGLAAVAVAVRRPEQAARLLGSAETLRATAQAMVWPAERFEWDRCMAALQTQLDAAALAAAWAQGQAATVDQAVNDALAVAAEIPARAAPATSAAQKAQYGGLTMREREVAALVAQGKSNRAIARQMVIAEGTAERHIANILLKLGFHTRAQIAAWAVEQGLAHYIANLHTPADQ